jgi:hypothetical protein
MFGTLISTACAVRDWAIEPVEGAVRRLRRLWRAHLDCVASNPGYAAATAAVLAGALGLMAARDVLAAVLAAAFGVCLRGTREAGGAARTGGPELDLY